MAKRLSEKQIQEIKQSFIQGSSVEILSKNYGCTKLTIIRNLKKHLGDSQYKELAIKNNSLIKDLSIKEKGKNKSESKKNNLNLKYDSININNLDLNTKDDNFSLSSTFFEITPLNYEINEESQKDLTSIPISDVEFPKLVYMIVDKKIELEIKLLKDYPEWRFLPEDDLNRKTIAVYLDLKLAKRFCNKEQKVIKVPNTDVFRIVAPLLISRGISRIVNEDRLISL
ncbi:hypothetical protein [Prochlorococcus marinus]|uniref:hypothetical protein n=1 Tax=Prochlorococcus marinus TaxID=1219 RepID=UPI001AD955F0|nr:hypothetical protein [Prochlorococcus marinus]MBO8219508.1 hypothetical protein [Prochlorococcus marinus CUG1416]MBW3051879.1 hypothetical protein [Prochlorococcus marinus str. MU1416]